MKLAPKDGIIATGDRLFLRRLNMQDNLQHYLDWLNDPEIQKFTRRRGRQSTQGDLLDFLRKAELGPDYHLAICLKGSNKHIGNISMNSIDALNQSGEISIMLGDRTEWGKGYGADAVALLTQFAFEELGLNRVWAESPNPAFNMLMKKLGWTEEGSKRDAFRLLDGNFVDLVCWSVTKNEYPRIKNRAS